jgi:hypothetical protein
MGLLSSIVGILTGVMNNFRDKFPMSDTITAQFVSHDLSGFTADFYEDFIDVECISITTMFTL